MESMLYLSLNDIVLLLHGIFNGKYPWDLGKVPLFISYPVAKL